MKRIKIITFSRVITIICAFLLAGNILSIITAKKDLDVPDIVNVVVTIILGLATAFLSISEAKKNHAEEQREIDEGTPYLDVVSVYNISDRGNAFYDDVFTNKKSDEKKNNKGGRVSFVDNYQKYGFGRELLSGRENTYICIDEYINKNDHFITIALKNVSDLLISKIKFYKEKGDSKKPVVLSPLPTFEGLKSYELDTNKKIDENGDSYSYTNCKKDDVIYCRVLWPESVPYKNTTLYVVIETVYKKVYLQKIRFECEKSFKLTIKKEYEPIVERLFAERNLYKITISEINVEYLYETRFKRKYKKFKNQIGDKYCFEDSLEKPIDNYMISKKELYFKKVVDNMDEMESVFMLGEQLLHYPEKKYARECYEFIKGKLDDCFESEDGMIYVQNEKGYTEQKKYSKLFKEVVEYRLDTIDNSPVTPYVRPYIFQYLRELGRSSDEIEKEISKYYYIPGLDDKEYEAYVKLVKEYIEKGCEFTDKAIDSDSYKLLDKLMSDDTGVIVGKNGCLYDEYEPKGEVIKPKANSKLAVEKAVFDYLHLKQTLKTKKM